MAAATISRVCALAFEILDIPQHDLRRHEADNADLQLACGARAIGNGFFDDRVGLEEQVVVLRIGGKLALRQVGADIREIGPAQNLEHIVEAIVELVIAQRSRLVAEHVHRLDDRMEIAFLHAMLIGHVVAHRVSLQEIAVIDEEGIAGLGADCVR